MRRMIDKPAGDWLIFRKHLLTIPPTNVPPPLSPFTSSLIESVNQLQVLFC